ncbi:MAG: esterase family protein [Mediterranea massiliensis]|nr:esterase family protein [Mediterranea massiliensis]
MKRIVFFLSLLCCVLWSAKASRTDSLQVFSKAMNRSIEVNVVVPEYEGRFPVLFILHGYSGDADNWLDKKPELKQYADRDGVIIVCPDGENSWYWDSPAVPESQFETFISKELIEYLDANYPTIAARSARAITGLSMGGHGAMWLSIRHSDVFGAAGSMSGGVDIRPFPKRWEMQKVLGAKPEDEEVYEKYAAINQISNLQPGQLELMICCGYDDFFYEVNNNFHQALLDKGIKHDFVVREGGHTWAYWTNAIDYHWLFFTNFFKKNHR